MFAMMLVRSALSPSVKLMAFVALLAVSSAVLLDFEYDVLLWVDC